MAGLGAKRKKNLAKSQNRQALSSTRRLRASSQNIPKSLTLLEAAAVRPSTVDTYQRAVSEFILLAQLGNRNWTSAAGLDVVMVEFLEVLFLDGAPLGSASATLAGIKHFLREHSAKNLTALPRCARAIKGWEKLAPAAQRLPMPRVLALAAAGILSMQKKPLMGLAIALSFVCYLRPSECIRLMGASLVNPRKDAARSVSATSETSGRKMVAA